jgi:signal transduction histidine kinase
MKRLIEDLLDLTRARLGGGIPVHRERIDLGNVCRETVEEARALHADRKIELEIDGDVTGEWDPARLSQMLANLVSNALQHGDEGAPVVVKATGRTANVEIVVHNNGPVIPERLRGRLFEPMVRASEPDSRSGGLGLGLFIVREIVTAHHGEVEVSSTIEEGTTFRVRLPRPYPEAASWESADRAVFSIRW